LNKDNLTKLISILILGKTPKNTTNDQLFCNLFEPKLPKGILTILKSIISGGIDVDRMDYLYRDSYYSGVKMGVFDIERILDCLFLWKDSKQKILLAIRSSGIPAFEHYLFCLYQMYIQVYYHKSVQACCAMLTYIQKNSPGFKPKLDTFLLDLENYYKLDDGIFVNTLREAKKDRAVDIENVFDDLFLKRRLWKLYLSLVQAGPFKNKLKGILKMCPPLKVQIYL
jgi:HD superfamily phosphohydrolase